MKNKILPVLCLLCFPFSLFNCGRATTGEQGGLQGLLNKARKNITTAESLSDINRRSVLLKTAEAQLIEAEAASQKQKIMEDETATVYAYYYFVSGDYSNAKKSAAQSINRNDPFIEILNTRISLKEKGKEAAADAAGVLERILAGSPENVMARLTLGDSRFLLGNFQEAQKHYTEVLKLGEAFQVQAADRLEVLDQIRRTGIDTKKVQNIILSLSVQRDEVADLLQRVYNADKYIKFSKTGEKTFTDASESLYADSIRRLREKGFFTYISGDKFEPYKTVTRGETAKIIEDFIVLKTGNTALRTKFSKDTKSIIRGLDVKDPYYNAVRTAVDAKVMDVSLDGSINPLEPISGLETIHTFSKLIK
ncbi:MAG: S-layer homology domain-containing protein [Spirochaetes bacterium]|nr:S-layer homology domain-containing protein [Spirochaetota bacterium]